MPIRSYMDIHQKLLSILIAEDNRLNKRGPCNIYRIEHYLKALDTAEQHPNGIEAGISSVFTHSRLRDKLRKSIGLETCKCQQANSCLLCR